MRAAACLLLVAVAVIATGCTGGGPISPPVTARDITPATSSVGGDGSYTLVIEVTSEPHGPPLAGAGVVLYWDDDAPAEGDQRPDDGALASANPGDYVSTPEPRSTLRLATDGNGKVVAHLPPNRAVGLVAAAPQWTEEWIPALATGGRGARDTTSLALYSRTVDLHINGTWGPGGASTGFYSDDNYLWKPEVVNFGASQAAHAGYAERLTELRVLVEWENGPGGGGDLAIGVGPTMDQPAFFRNGGTHFGLGNQSEESVLKEDTLHRFDLVGAVPIHAGPATDKGYFAPTGLPYHLEVVGSFDAQHRTGVSGGWGGGSGGGSVGGGSGGGASVPFPAWLVLAATPIAVVLRSRTA